MPRMGCRRLNFAYRPRAKTGDVFGCMPAPHEGYPHHPCRCAQLATYAFLITHKPQPVSAASKALELFGHWPAKAWHHSGEVVSPVESVLELGEVSWDVLAVDVPICSHDRGLDVAERGVNPLERWRARGGRPAARLDGLVGASGIGHAGEAGQAIADHLTRSIKVTLGEPRQGVAGKTTDTAQFHADRLAIRGRLHRGDEGRLPRRPAPSLTTGAFAAKVGVVNLDTPGQFLGGIALHHDLFEFVLDFPSGGLAHAETPAKLDAGNPLLGLGHVVHGAEPDTQGQFGHREDRSGDRRGLPATGRALKEASGFDQTVRTPAAGGTFEPIRPSRLDDDRAALLLGAVLLFRKRARRDLSGTGPHCEPLRASTQSPLFMICTISELAEEGA
jgi:hypothetical protein